MKGHTVTLQDQEFKLLQKIRSIGDSRETQEALIENLIQEIETMFAQQPPKKPIKWLQIGKRTGFRPFHPVTPEPGAPLASDIILEQRNRLTRNRK